MAELEVKLQAVRRRNRQRRLALRHLTKGHQRLLAVHGLALGEIERYRGLYVEATKAPKAWVVTYQKSMGVPPFVLITLAGAIGLMLGSLLRP